MQKRTSAFKKITHYTNLQKQIVITLLRHTVQKILIQLEQMLKLYTYVPECEII